MPVVDVVNLDGKKVGQVDLADSVFGAEVNSNLLHEASRWYLNGLRRGTHKTKEKSEVSGAGRKLWRQKGTGRARIGSIRSPLWRHGGTVHGPRPRSYAYALPKKMLLGALRSALSAKLAESKLTVIDAWSLDTHKTKTLRTALDKLNAAKTALLVAVGDNKNLELASRNLDGVKLSATNALQPYDVLRHDRLVVSKDAIARLVRALDPEHPSVAAPHVESIAPAPVAAKEAKSAAKPAAKKFAAAKKPAAKKGKE
ncbi:MAG TPA: 50S ribosomal protein L4 [Candidatus Saccharimonadales bacterium]|nr:50S ribosomal protein L4 [Candidatus Saccharimonadales bacterium]